ncbi:hypothetical protein GCM10023116_10980 [Kistimonas scapharcae]|uniref:Type 4 fimbrial biogenesis protein PilX N-terminal domain-containing protein n=1 Tax=Kistimonas scapharcae TaxID=1036133 RepID=A0ABP8UYA6_9GAMM
MRQQRPDRTPHHQQGITLVVALVILMMLSILALTAAYNASLMTAMAGHSHHQGLTFQGARSELSAQVAGVQGNSSFNNAITSGNAVSAAALALNRQTPPITQVITVDHQATGTIPLGEELNGGNEYFFNIHSTATLASGATSNQTQGIFYRIDHNAVTNFAD